MFSGRLDSKGLLSVCGIHALDDPLGSIDADTGLLLRIKMEHANILSRMGECRYERRR